MIGSAFRLLIVELGGWFDLIQFFLEDADIIILFVVLVEYILQLAEEFFRTGIVN